MAERKYEDVIDQLLFNRDVISDDLDTNKKREFLKPNFDQDLADPFLLPDLKKAIDRIKLAVERQEKVGVFADYDADGTPGAALLYRALRKIGLDVEVYLPSRLVDGYGLNQRGIDYLHGKQCSLIITVDLGIRSGDEADYCEQKGMDLIITDHHLPGLEIPRAFCVVNPKLSDEANPLYHLCGCGVVFKLIQGLGREYNKISESFIKWNLDLVAISTIADMVPLSGENRLLAKFGLKVLRKTKNIGLKALIQTAKIEAGRIDPYTVGFQIGPRINTPGRIDHATKSFELLITNSELEATVMAENLNQMNVIRQSEMDKVFDEAVAMIEENVLSDKPVIVISGQWSKGILGPPASRLVEKYYRPVILLSQEDEELTGSARSIPGVHILNLLESVAPTLIKYGGHKGAAGLAVRKDKYDDFLKNIYFEAKKTISSEVYQRKVKIDAKLDITDLTKALILQIEELEPFGLGNPRPVFLLEDIELSNIRQVGNEGRHLSACLKESGTAIKCIFFNYATAGTSIQHNTKYDMIFNVSLDSWNNQEKVSLNLCGIRESAGE